MQRNHDVYFEFYGRKMRAKILAETKEEAIQQIKDKIIFHKVVVDKKDEFNHCIDILDSIVSGLKDK